MKKILIIALVLFSASCTNNDDENNVSYYYNTTVSEESILLNNWSDASVKQIDLVFEENISSSEPISIDRFVINSGFDNFEGNLEFETLNNNRVQIKILPNSNFELGYKNLVLKINKNNVEKYLSILFNSNNENIQYVISTESNSKELTEEIHNYDIPHSYEDNIFNFTVYTNTSGDILYEDNRLFRSVFVENNSFQKYASFGVTSIIKLYHSEL